MENMKYDEDIVKRRAVNSESLNSRLIINQKYQSKNFHDWLHKRLNVLPGENILDVGCGTGAQSLKFLEKIGKTGTVSALDINEDSVKNLLELSGGDKRLEVAVADMADIENVINSKFHQKKYTLAHSSYALYYSPENKTVLNKMADSISNYGRVAVFTPVYPHGMVEIAEKFSNIPDKVYESLEFGPKVLEPEFRSLFYEVEIHFFQSEMKVSSIDDFMNFYSSTTYFDEKASKEIEKYAKSEIKDKGAISYEKNGYLIIGRDKKVIN